MPRPSVSADAYANMKGWVQSIDDVRTRLSGENGMLKNKMNVDKGLGVGMGTKRGTMPNGQIPVAGNEVALRGTGV